VAPFRGTDVRDPQAASKILLSLERDLDPTQKKCFKIELLKKIVFIKFMLSKVYSFACLYISVSSDIV
jgi:hypothetical protein